MTQREARERLDEYECWIKIKWDNLIGMKYAMVLVMRNRLITQLQMCQLRDFDYG